MEQLPEPETEPEEYIPFIVIELPKVIHKITRDNFIDDLQVQHGTEQE